MGGCCPEHGGVEDTAGMQVFDSFGLGSRRWSGKVDCQKCNIRSCRTWSRRMKGEERLGEPTSYYSRPLVEPTVSSAESLVTTEGAPAAIGKDLLPARLEDQLFRTRVVASQSRE